MTSLLITGATGYLAHRLMPIAERYASVTGLSRTASDPAFAFHHLAADVGDLEALRSAVKSVSPDAIIHAAAANPGSTEDAMKAVNHRGTENIARVAVDTASRLVVVSTDVVHNGSNAPYADDADAQPLDGNVYGQTKWLGEQAVLSSGANAIIVRTSLIYGLEQMDRGTEGFAQRLNQGEPLALFNDVIRQPVWVDSLATVLCELAFNHAGETGIINVAGAEPISRADFGLRLLRYWGIDTANRVTQRSGRGIKGLPVDLRLQLSRADSLGFRLPGVGDVLAG